MTSNKILESIGSILNSLGKYLNAPNIIDLGISLAVNGLSTVTDLDAALVKLQKNTGMTAKELEDFYDTSNDLARQLGVTTSQIIDQTAAWMQLGIRSQETAAKMAELSSQFAAISPGMETQTAVSSLSTVMQAYKMNADMMLDGAISKINETANQFRTSNAEIAEGLQQSAFDMAAAGTTLEQNIALFTAGQEVIHDASQVSSALQTIAQHMQGYNEKTRELSGELLDLNIRITDLTKTYSIGNYGISLFSDSSHTQCKDLVTYLREISHIWNELDSKSKNAILEQLFGSDNTQAGAAILSNFDAVTASIETMSHSAGSANLAMSDTMDTLEYKLSKLSETGTGIAQNLFQRDEMKSVLDLLNSFLGVLDQVTDMLHLLGTLGAGVGLFASFKNVGSLKMYRLTIV